MFNFHTCPKISYFCWYVIDQYLGHQWTIFFHIPFRRLNIIHISIIPTVNTLSRSVQTTGKLIFHSEITPEVKEVTFHKLSRLSEWLRLEGSSGGHLVQTFWLNQHHQDQIAQGCPMVKHMTWVPFFRLLSLQAHKSANLPTCECQPIQKRLIGQNTGMVLYWYSYWGTRTWFHFPFLLDFRMLFHLGGL